ncbi:MAG: helix-turn-helix transcriptional regulator [Dehalococcoidia bacterium]
METIESVLSRLDTYAKELGISRKELADRLDTPYSTVKHWFQHGRSARKPSEANLAKITGFLKNKRKPQVYPQVKDARRRADKIKYLLLLLEDELGWFRDNGPDAREIFRKELNASDIAYISSLLTMIREEDKFERWRALTTIQFQSFKGR